MSLAALDGIKILDLTQVMAGPYCCQLLGDYGADVIKVEPSGGDATRKMGFFLKGEDAMAFHAVNRNKKSMTLDLKDPRGREVFDRLLADTDVVVENFRPGVAARLGVDYETLSKKHPKLVYASISGFGQTGPYGGRGGYDLIAQAMSGLMSVTGEPGSNPVKAGVPVADLSAGLYAAIGILTAIVSREKTGEGQYVDVSLLESALSLMVWETAETWGTGNVPQAMGSAHRLAAPYQALRASDGYFVVGASNQGLWERLAVAIDRADLIEDPRFVKNMDRMNNLDQLVAELEKTFSTGTAEHWIGVLSEAGIPAGPLYNTKQAVEDPHVLARGMVQEVEHPVEGTVKTLGVPFKLSRTPGQTLGRAPLLGEHNRDVLGDLGYSEDEMDVLQEAGVIGVPTGIESRQPA